MEKNRTISSRAVALEVLQAILRKKQPLEETLENNDAFRKLEQRDRAFVHLIIATTLRRLGQIDEAIKACLDKRQDLKTRTLDILRLGAAQILFIETPPHAAVDTAVELAASSNATAPYKGLTNAVLRRLAREGKSMLEKQDAERLNTPPWLANSLNKSYGAKTAVTIEQSFLEEASVDLTIKGPADEWAKKLSAQILPTGSLRLPREFGNKIDALPGFAEGEWWVQDASAAIPARLFGNIKGKTVVDLCAAPGGKTMQLAAMGANVIAVDRSEKRLKRLKENLARTRLSAEIVCSDGTVFIPGTKVDFVLLDAPCSATGTIRRHPEIPHIKTEDDVTRLVELQEKLLEHAFSRIVAPGGTIIYAVCSLQCKEAEGQVEKFLKNHKNAKRLPIEAREIDGCKALLTTQGDLRCLPCHWPETGGLDGFFAARIKNIG